MGEYVEHAITIKGADVTMKFPPGFSDGQVAESVANIEAAIDAFGESKSKGRTGAARVLDEVRKVDPDNKLGHKLWYDPYMRQFKQVLRATANVTEATISEYFSGIREDLGEDDPWYLDPDRKGVSASGGPAKGSSKATSQVERPAIAIEDPDRFDVDSLIVALAIRLKNLNAGELKNPVGTLTELEDLKDSAIPHGLAVVHGFIRQNG